MNISSLGAHHDGVNNLNCTHWDNFIMAPKFQPYNQLNSWLFSKCSKIQLKEFLMDYEKYSFIYYHMNSLK